MNVAKALPELLVKLNELRNFDFENRLLIVDHLNSSLYTITSLKNFINKKNP